MINDIIYLNGNFIAQDDAKLSALSPGVQYGWGVFETMRAYNGHIVYLNAHLARMQKSCALLKINSSYPLSKYKQIIQGAIMRAGVLDIRLRLTLLKNDSGADVLLAAGRYLGYAKKKYNQGFSACVSSLRQGEGVFLARVKSTNYLLYSLAHQEARDRGFDEALLLNNRGYIAEASRANIFLVKNRHIYTPAIECGCLHGITRGAIFDIAKKLEIGLSQGFITARDLSAADEAFITNSLLGVMPLTSLERRPLGYGRAGLITRIFMREYENLLKNAAAKD